MGSRYGLRAAWVGVMSKPFTIHPGEPDPLAPFLPAATAVSAIQARVKALAELIGADLAGGPWIAGGAVLSMLTGDEPGDIDVFFRTEEQADRVEGLLKERGEFLKEMLGSDDGKGRPIRSTMYDVEGVGVVNVARTHMWPSVEALLRSFDFTVCQFATHGSTLVHGGPNVVWCAVNRILVPTRPTTRGRVSKYLAKGYQLGEVYREAWAAGGVVPGLLAPDGEALISQIDPSDFF